MLSRTTIKEVAQYLIVLVVVCIVLLILFILFLAYVRNFWPDERLDGPEPLSDLRSWGGHPPQWFPDGDRIAFSHEGAVYVVDSTGSRLQLVDGGDGELDLAHGPSVSPDGSRIAYTSYERYGWWWDRSESWEIVTTKPDGSDRRRLTENDIRDLNPVWSHDGTRIFFHKKGALYAMAADGSDESVKVVEVEEGPIVRGFALSPDGSHLAFGAEVQNQGRVMYAARADGSGLTWLADTGLLAWSPDSLRIAYFVKGEVGGVSRRIYTIEVDGSDVREIISFLNGGVAWADSLSWSPDGSEILYGKNIIAADGSAVRKLPVPDGHGSWSPDSSRIAVYNEDWSSSVVLATVARDGTDVRVLVARDEEGNLVAAKGRAPQAKYM